jgi:hypothetical protein
MLVAPVRCALGAAMKRREFITFIGGVAATWPLAVQAQTKKRPLVGWLWYSKADIVVGYLEQLLKGMRELGLIEGRDFDMVYRSAEFHVERLPRAAEELVQLKPDLIVAPATLQAVAAKKATDTIPIVVPVLADPVGLGFVASEARPSGNVTGIAPYVKGLIAISWRRESEGPNRGAATSRASNSENADAVPRNEPWARGGSASYSGPCNRDYIDVVFQMICFLSRRPCS